MHCSYGYNHAMNFTSSIAMPTPDYARELTEREDQSADHDGNQTQTLRDRTVKVVCNT